MRRYIIVVTVCFFTLSPAFAQDDMDMVSMVLEGLSDPDLRGIYFDLVRSDVKGMEATKAFAGALPTLPPAVQAGMIRALADRGDTAAKPAVAAMLQSEDEATRIAALRALSKLGDTTDCKTLVDWLAKTGSELDAAKTSLIQIQGEGVTKAIAELMDGATTATSVSLIEILASRRALDTIPIILEAAVSDAPKVRAAAMSALGGIAGPEHIAGMVQGVLKSEGSERANAERSIAMVCNRIDDAATRTQPLVEAIDQLQPADQQKMLITLGRVGGTSALTRIEQALASEDAAMHRSGLAALANWPDASVADKLEQLAYNDANIKNQRTALRAMIRLAPMNDGRTSEARLAFLKKVMDMCVYVEDRKYCLQRSGAIRLVESLRWLLPFVEDPRYAEQACTSIVELAHIRDLRDDNKEEFHSALDKVMATSKNSETLDRANRYKKGQTWVRPK